MLQSQEASAPTGQGADWSELLPELLAPRKPPTVEQFSEAVQAVTRSFEQGYINKDEAELLLRHLCSAFVANEVADLLSKWSITPFAGLPANEPSGLLRGMARW